jgi:CBS domain-containing protein
VRLFEFNAVPNYTRQYAQIMTAKEAHMSLTLVNLLKKKTNIVHSIAPQETVQQAAVKMAELGIGSLLVIDKQQLVGIFTERDVVNKLFKDRLDPNKVTVGELMTKNLVFAKPTTTIEEAMATFTKYRFRHLPVIDGTQLIGMISIGDVMKWIITNQQTELTCLTEYIRGETR